MNTPPPPPHWPSHPPVPPPLPPERPPLPPPASPPPGGKGRYLWISLVILVLGGSAYWSWKNKNSQRARFEAESAEERAAGIRAAFHGTGEPVSLTSPEAKAIDAVFRRIFAAYEKKDAAALAECFDFAGVMEMAADQNPSPEMKRRARAARRDPGLVRKNGITSLQSMVQNSDHKSYEIRRLEVAADGKQALALVVWKNAGGSRSKERYWFLRGIDWRVCDFEELETAVRWSTSAAAAADHPDALQSGRSTMADFQKLVTAVCEGEPDKARPLLLKVRSSPAGALFSDVTDVLEVNLLVQEEKSEEALSAAERIIKRRPDIPGAHSQRAIILADLGRHEESITAAQKYLDILGDDPATLNLIASSHLALKQPDKARDCALRVLAETPPDEEALVYFGRTARPEDAAKLEELLRKSDNAEGCIQSIASDLQSAPGSAAFAVLMAVAEKVAPESDVTASLKTGRRARELWAKVTAAGAAGDDLLASALQEGSAEEAEALDDTLRDLLGTAQDAAGLERLAAAGTRSRPDSTGPLHARAAAEAIRLRPEIEKAADPDKSLVEALKAAALPGWVAWNLAMAWQEADKPDLANKAAAALKKVAPDDEMNEPMADFLGEETDTAPEKEDQLPP